MKKKRNLIVAGLLCCIALSGCGKEAVEATSNPMSTTRDLPLVMGNGELDGKVLLSNIYYTNDNTTMTFDIYTMTMTNEKEFELVRSFTVPNAESPIITIHEPYASVAMFFNFTEDFTKLAVTREGHAGWVDCAGNFTDVTDTLGEQTEEGCSALGFTKTGRFVYRNNDIEAYYSVNPGVVNGEKIDKQPYDYDISDFMPTNQAFQKIAMDETHTCWSKISNPDGSKMIFYAMSGEDVSTKALYILPTLGKEASEVCAIPATKMVLKLSETDKYDVVFGDAVLDWR